jgi:hypothetical protein
VIRRINWMPSAIILRFLSLNFLIILSFSNSLAQSVSPDTINFGSLRIGRTADSSFEISGPIELRDTSFKKYIHTGQFIADPYSGSTSLGSGDVAFETVHFHPLKRGYFTDTILVTSFSANTEKVILRGRGIDYIIPDQNYSFGKVRLGKADTTTIRITNLGDDTTSIYSIQLENTPDFRDFGIIQDSLPQKLARVWFLDTLAITNPKNTASFKVFFLPKFDPANNIVDTGFRMAIVKILKADGRIIHDTLFGIGAEPWLTASPLLLDFGTINNPTAMSSADTILYDTIRNTGTMTGILDSLRGSDTTFFSIRKATQPTVSISDNIPVSENVAVPIAVVFHIKQTGDFYDTIRASNDSRSQPLIIAKGSVRAGIAPLAAISLDTIINCTPVDRELVLHNPFRVNVQIDSFWFEGNTGGFELLDTDRTQPIFLNFPIFIEGDSTFTLHIRYKFPVDSLNGFQIARIILKLPTGGDIRTSEYDTAILTLTRKTTLLNLAATLPPYRPSAKDLPFRLPVYIRGDRTGKQELDNDTLKLVFSNKLIKPVGIDRTGSLTESINGIPPQPPPIWDEVNSTYLVPMVGLHISTDFSKNLLLTLICTAYLSSDTVVSITPVIGYIDPPCAYRVARDSTVISYANECGDRTIRDMLLSSAVPIQIGAAIPDPVFLQQSENVVYNYNATKDLILSWKLYDPTGVVIQESLGAIVRSGSGTLAIPMKQINASGAHYLEVIILDPQSGNQTRITSKFTVLK